jgi:hypothetical protein
LQKKSHLKKWEPPQPPPPSPRPFRKGPGLFSLWCGAEYFPRTTWAPHHILCKRKNPYGTRDLLKNVSLRRMRQCKGMPFFRSGKSLFYTTTKMSHSAHANPQYSGDKL